MCRCSVSFFISPIVRHTIQEPIMVVILSVLDSFARGVYVPRQTTVLTFVHRYVIAFRCGATSGAIYCPMLLFSRTCKSHAEIYSRLFTFSFYFVISNANSFSFDCSMHVYEPRSINDNKNTTMILIDANFFQ